MHHRFRFALADTGETSAAVTRDLHHRMAEHVHADALLGQRHRHRIDEERHVVVDDLQHRVRRFPAVRLEHRIEQAHVRRARLALGREFEQVGGERGPAVRGVQRNLLLGHAPVEGFGESARIPVRGLARAAAHGVEDRGEQARCRARRRGRRLAGRGRGFGRGFGRRLRRCLGRGFGRGIRGGFRTGLAGCAHDDRGSDAMRPAFSRGPTGNNNGCAPPSAARSGTLDAAAHPRRLRGCGTRWTGRGAGITVRLSAGRSRCGR